MKKLIVLGLFALLAFSLAQVAGPAGWSWNPPEAAQAAEPGYACSKFGWGPRDAEKGGTIPIKVFTVPAGNWQLSAPVRLRWGGGTGYIPGIEWEVISGSPELFLVSDHFDIQRQWGDENTDNEYTLFAAISTTEPITVELHLEVSGENVVMDVVDGDGVRCGVASG